MMTTKTILMALLLQFGGDGSAPPDLCKQEVFRDVSGAPLKDARGTMLSRTCAWSGPDAPLWQDLACCNVDDGGSSCVVAERDSCELGFDPYYCEYGVELDDGGLLCYQPFPSTCAHGSCAAEPLDLASSELYQEGVICCIGPICYPWHGLDWDDCHGHYTWCDDGYSTVEGTVECFD